jgi:NitT/TauT family transport system substrate-binding protein
VDKRDLISGGFAGANKIKSRIIRQNKEKNMKKVLTVLVVLALALVIVACKASSKEEAGAESASLTPVTLMMPRSVESLEDGPLYAALAMGYWREEGLDVSIVDGGVDDCKMLETGQANFATPAPAITIPAIANGIKVKSFFQYDNIDIFGFAVQESSSIRTWSDMKGKSIALGMADWQGLAEPILLAAGINPKTDVQWIVAGESRAAMVENGNIDILFTWVSEVYQYNGQGLHLRYIDGNEVFQNCGNSFITSQDMIDNHPELVVAFARGLAKGMWFVKSSPEASADISMQKFPAISVPWDVAVLLAKGRADMNFGLTAEDQAMIGSNIGWHYEDKWQLNMQGSIDSGTISSALPLNQVYTNDFIEQANNFDRAAVERDAANYQFKVKP